MGLESLLASLTPIANHRPWHRYVVDAATWDALGAALGRGEGDLISLWGEGRAVHMSLRSLPEAPFVVSLAVDDLSFPSIGKYHAPAIRLERTICDLYGF